MKKFLVVVFCLALAAAGYAQNKEALCKKWRVSIDDFFKNLPAEVEKAISMMNEEEKKLFRGKITENFENAYVHFMADGTLESFFDNFKKRGNWQFSDNGMAIESTEDGNTTVLDILLLTSEKMILKERGKEKDPAMTFVPFDSK